MPKDSNALDDSFRMTYGSHSNTLPDGKLLIKTVPNDGPSEEYPRPPPLYQRAPGLRQMSATRDLFKEVITGCIFFIVLYISGFIFGFFSRNCRK